MPVTWPGKFKRGDRVITKIIEPGGGQVRYAGSVKCIVLHSGIELTLMIDPMMDDVEEIKAILYAGGIESMEDLRQGPVYVLDCVQPEDTIHTR
jgi:hypothetical protein